MGTDEVVRRVVVLARAPSAGGKTRLTAGMPADRAESLKRALLADTLAAVAAAEVPYGVHVTPAEALDEVAAIAGPDVPVRPQGAGDLGQRMATAFTGEFAAGATEVVLIGSDLPTLPASCLTGAFAALAAGAGVVLGPADDGGYYLVALSQPRPGLFAGVDWGGPDVLRQTIDAARRLGLEAALLAPWYDVDEPEDVRRVITSSAPALAVRAWVAAKAAGPSPPVDGSQ